MLTSQEHEKLPDPTSEPSGVRSTITPVAVEDSVVDTSLAEWLQPQELLDMADSGRVVLLPDRVGEFAGRPTASFRDDAQALRVAAMAEGREVVMATPEGAGTAIYREHAADWVMPIVFSVPASVVATLVANPIQRFLIRSREDTGVAASPTPTVRYREATIVDGEVKLREIEGPAPDVISILRSDITEPSSARRLSPAAEHEGDQRASD
jgi:hypothetical protein